jgi:formylglycine-generating enzyme required for sulfatase activity
MTLGENPAQRGMSRDRVLRGGSFDNEPRNLRSANRNRNEPENRNDNVGFRCVRSGAPTCRPGRMAGAPGR